MPFISCLLRGRSTLTTLAATLALAACAADDPTGAVGLARGDRGPQVAELHRYLYTYGYAAASATPDVFDEALERALVAFQVRYGLPADGVVNEPTRVLVETPRCSMPDAERPLDGMTGFPNFVAGPYKWSTNSLSYSFANTTADLATGTQQSTISGALARWAAVAPLTFTLLGSGGDIKIGFYSGDHGDGFPFDGTGNIPNVLAHTFLPAPDTFDPGDVHFDDAETWRTDGLQVDLGTVAVHELGHALGMRHSAVASAVMFAANGGVRRDLTADDILGIQSLYLRVPNPITKSSEHCMGINNVSWTAQTAATYYELHRSLSPSFTGPVLVYSGAQLSTTIDVPPSTTWYLRARSCNTYGCSAFGSQVSATYWTGMCQ